MNEVGTEAPPPQSEAASPKCGSGTAESDCQGSPAEIPPRPSCPARPAVRPCFHEGILAGRILALRGGLSKLCAEAGLMFA